jgi:hypothetical protein
MCNIIFSKIPKWSLLIIFLLSLFITLLPTIPELEVLNTPYYVVPMSILTSLIAFYSIPFFTEYLYEREIKFKDLVDHSALTLEEKNKYLLYHKYGLYILSAGLCGWIIYYYIFEFRTSKLSWFETFGMIRGIITYYYDFQHIASRYMKKLLHNIKSYITRNSPQVTSMNSNFKTNSGLKNKSSPVNSEIQMAIQDPPVLHLDESKI